MTIENKCGSLVIIVGRSIWFIAAQIALEGLLWAHYERALSQFPVIYTWAREWEHWEVSNRREKPEICIRRDLKTKVSKSPKARESLGDN